MDPDTHLSNLGLSDYEARAYTSLVKRPAQTADQVSDHADVPKGRIYDVLNSLAEQDLVRSDRERPRSYTAVEPSVAMDRLFSNKQQELERELSEYEKRVSETRQVLEDVEPTETDEEFWTTAIKEDEARDLLLERLSLATDEVAIYKGTPGVDPTTWKRATDILKTLIEDGVSIRLLMDEEHGINEALVSDHLPVAESGLRIRQVSLPSRSHFYVIDGTEASLEIPHPSQATIMLAVLNFRNSDVVTDLADSFESLWEEGDASLPVDADDTASN